MRNLSITMRLFGITALFFILVITAIMILHTTFFESYYQKKKTTALLTGLTQLREDIKARPSDLKSLTLQFEEKYNADVVVTIRSSKDVGVYIPTKPQPPNIKLSNELDIKISRSISIALDVAQVYDPHSVKYRQLIKQTSATLYSNPMNETLLSNHILALTNLTPELVKPIMADQHNLFHNSFQTFSAEIEQRPILMALASLQPVGEAAGIFKELYQYIYAIAILVILLMTFIISRMITRPLIRLNAAAAKMAKLDFSVACEVKSKDEIGGLGRTLNFLSHNLRDTIGKLNSANEQLKRDIELEKQMDKMRKEFVAGVSHELKTPLSVISGYAEGLRDGVARGDRREEYLDVILAESANMTRLVTDMLDLSQLESGKYTLKISTFDIMGMTRSVVERIQLLSTAKRAEWIFNFLEMDEMTVLGDPNRIEQVLKNLLTNAVRHTDQEGRIAIRILQLPHDEVEISITNSGEPIPEHSLPYIWDTFYKVDPSRSPDEHSSANGTGIGLAIVKNILVLHQSRYHAINGDGEVTFTFTLRK